MERITPVKCTLWNVVYTKPNCEKKVAELLSKKHIENYLPLKTIRAPWWVPKKSVEVPLFNSLVFVKASPEASEVKKIDGVINLLYWLGEPAIIKNSEIEAIQQFLYNHKDVAIQKTSIGLNYSANETINISLSTKMGNDIYRDTNSTEIPSLGFRLVAKDHVSDAKVITLEKPATPLKVPYSHAS